MYREYELKAIYGRNKSYYGKAHIKIFDGFKTLQSYTTDVCYMNGNGDFFRTWSGWSATTSRHVNEFRMQNGLKAIGKKEWEALPVVEPLRPLKAIILEYFKIA